MGKAERDKRRDANTDSDDLAVGIDLLSCVASLIACAWYIVLNWPDGWAQMLALITPPLAVSAAVIQTVYLLLTGAKPPSRPLLFVAIALSGIGLYVATIFNTDFLDSEWTDIVVAVLGILIVIMGMGVFSKPEASDEVQWNWFVAAMLVGVLFYVDAAAKKLDVWLDTSSPRVYHPTVLDKRIELHAKFQRTYYVTVSAWGPTQSEEIDIPFSFYESVYVGTRLCASVQDGYFGWRYRKIVVCP